MNGILNDPASPIMHNTGAIYAFLLYTNQAILKESKGATCLPFIMRSGSSRLPYCLCPRRPQNNMRSAIIVVLLMLQGIHINTIVEGLNFRAINKLKSIVSTLLISSSIISSGPIVSISENLPTQSAVEQIQPSDKDIQAVQIAFRDFNLKRFDDSEKEFTISINKWKELHRPRDEIVSLLKARANVRLDNKDFNSALVDYNEALELMKVDGEKDDGTGRYPEYPDTFVGRGLAKEGLADWDGAILDYTKAISLWGGGRGEGVNPYVLTFRGNAYCKLSKYRDAIPDYEAASDRFNALRDVDRYADSKANLALALYEVGNTGDAVKAMNDVIRKVPGYADMHVALAADYWGRGDYINALKEWSFTCDRIEVGCSAYKDLNWVSTIRRWPPSLTNKLKQFLNREIPDALKGSESAVLAPKPR